MPTVRLLLDKRAKSKGKDGKYPLVMRIGHQSTSRNIPFDLHLLPEQFDENALSLSGILNSVRNTKRIQKKLSEVDLWVDENKAEIKLWSIGKLKEEIERRFFNKQSVLQVLVHGAKVLHRFYLEEKFSTVDSYEDALKMLVKYQMKLKRENDRLQIKTLFNKSAEKSWEVLESYQLYDMPIKAFNTEFAEDFKAYMAARGISRNSISIHLRSLQSILNKAERSYVELKGHKPLEGIRKTSTSNAPVVLLPDEIKLLRETDFERGTSKFHVINYFLFMFGNMGMNFFDLALARVRQFDGERFNYTRKKTETEGDFFSIKQSEETLRIIAYYSKGKSQEEYLFPLIPEDTPAHRIHRVKKDKAHWFNKHMKQIAQSLEIEKNITTYTARDTWTNLGLQMGIDIRKISSGLGHSSVQVTEKHYTQALNHQILDVINAQITA